MAIYFISDMHFLHDRDFIWGPRGCGSLQEMHDKIIRAWNGTVQEEDEVYHLGDFCLGTDQEKIEELIGSLHGRIHLTIGNHDTPKKVDFYRSQAFAGKIVEVCYATMIRAGRRHLYLSHYPTIVSDRDTGHRTAVYGLHGHIHTKEIFLEDNPYLYNVCCDAHDCRPVFLEQVLEDIRYDERMCRKSLH